MAPFKMKRSALSQVNPLKSPGIRKLTPPNVFSVNRAPTVNDYRGYQIGDEWIDRASVPANNIYKLVNKEKNVASWINLAGGGQTETLSGDVGGAVGPDGADNINVLGTTDEILTTGNPGTNTITYSLVIPLLPTKGGTGVVSPTDHSLLVGSGATTMTELAVGATNQVLLGNTGADPSWGAVDLATDVTGLLPIGSGGTGVANLLDHSLLVGSGATDMTELGVATDGQLPIGSAGADPVLSTITASGAITVTNGPGSITIGGGGTTWNIITADLNPMVVYNGYICNKAGLLSLTLPATSAVGTTLSITGINVDLGWGIVQGAGQQIHFGSMSSTIGAGGSLASTLKHDSVAIVCVVADLEWLVINAVGNLTVV